MKYKLLPLFDNLNHLHKNQEYAILPHPQFQADFNYSLNFLKSYTGSLGTFNSYREKPSVCCNGWLIKNQTLATLKREDIEQYIHFCQTHLNQG